MHYAITFGEILWDNFKEGRKAGGAPMNVALHLHKQGIQSRLISSLGCDDDGKELLSFLQTQGMSTDLVQEHPSLPTGLVEVELDSKQQASYIIKEPVAWDEIKYTKELEQAVKDSDLLVFGSLASRNESSRNTLLKLIPLAKFRVFDMNLRPPHFNKETITQLMQHCNLLKINEDELAYLEGMCNLPQAPRRDNLLLLSSMLNIPLICVTLGDKGALVVSDNRLYEHQGFMVEVADTVGAGDAFLAAFISSLLQDLPIETVLERACAAGAIVASKAGANPDYSPEEIVNNSLKANKSD
ncbi:fructokinase [Arcticibacter tournemirensis]|uniref:Carbohydrate kinase n=1 Tax=Arcticibacter tournemirensis TaxID=699437 RepID=A0A5M9H031_9SPHI|nr:carbohydrate kinase [Arcticibacter tournemirensis]KAA8478937.1 carbohydrate kinase [Arcticibacter tournemirensis]TQM49158.1 fructokinase [Arcticibacter tournemirensis]